MAIYIYTKTSAHIVRARRKKNEQKFVRIDAHSAGSKEESERETGGKEKNPANHE